MKLKLIALLLSAVMLIPPLAACADSPATTTAGADVTTEATTEAPIPEEPEVRTTLFAEPGLALMHQIIDDYWIARSKTLREEKGGGGAAFVWSYASFLEALAETYRLYPDDVTVAKTYKSALEGLEAYAVNATITAPTGRYKVTYYNASRGSSGDYYYDDDAWVCLQFLNAYELLGDAQYLEKAEKTLEFLWTGWDDVLDGGIYWKSNYSSKNTCANGPIAIAFLWAYQLTQNSDYLSKGAAIYEWTREVLLDGSLYCDSIGKDGNKNTWKAAYNQGVMIYAGAQLYEITGDGTYLKQARATTNASVNLMFKGSGSNTTMNDNPIYKAWCVGWLTRGFLKFYSVDPKKNTTAMKRLEAVLENTLETKDRSGYYDPYFCNPNAWSSESRTCILQPAGVCTVFCLSAYYDLVLK
ncbi:MAG: glycoside hydrolase family 76 protein [Eubacteriales bacterium]